MKVLKYIYIYIYIYISVNMIRRIIGIDECTDKDYECGYDGEQIRIRCKLCK